MLDLHLPELFSPWSILLPADSLPLPTELELFRFPFPAEAATFLSILRLTTYSSGINTSIYNRSIDDIIPRDTRWWFSEPKYIYIYRGGMVDEQSGGDTMGCGPMFLVQTSKWQVQVMEVMNKPETIVWFLARKLWLFVCNGCMIAHV